MYNVDKPTELLEFLYTIPNYTKKEMKALLTHGSVLVDGKVITKYNYIVKKSQNISINTYNKSSEIDIIYEDKDIIVVNKPDGILSISTDNKDSKTMYKLVSDYVKSKDKKNKIFVVHRLDRETSGVLIFAKNEKIKYLFQDNWDSLVLKREYVAIVNGKLESGTIKSYLNENKEHFVYSASTGKLAITNYIKIKQNENYTWLLIDLETGRKNQIRVHMKDLGHTVVGDTKYGTKDIKYKRLCLHAYKLVVINPITKKEMTFTSKIPKIFNIKDHELV